MKKLPMVYRQSMRSYFIVFGIALATVFGLQLLSLIFAGSHIDLNINDFINAFSGQFIAIAFGIYGLFYLVVPYREFKLGIQNGQTRWQIWLSDLLGIVTITLITFIIWLISVGFQHQDWLTIAGTLLMMLDGITFSYAIGSGFGLLPRKWKIIVLSINRAGTCLRMARLILFIFSSSLTSAKPTVTMISLVFSGNALMVVFKPLTPPAYKPPKCMTTS